MTHDERREALLKAYSGPRWESRVQSMSEKQIYAVYKRLQSQGKVS